MMVLVGFETFCRESFGGGRKGAVVLFCGGVFSLKDESMSTCCNCLRGPYLNRGTAFPRGGLARKQGACGTTSPNVLPTTFRTTQKWWFSDTILDLGQITALV